MPATKIEHIKIYIVIALALVATIVGYFRFIHKKTTPDIGRTASIATPSQVQTPQTEIKIPERKRDKQAELHMDDSQRIDIRDIFTPLHLLKKAKRKPRQKKAPPPMPTKVESPPKPKKPPPPAVMLKLNGTIVGGKNPVAIINNQFVRTGEWIGGYRVVKIDKYKVLLSSGGYQKILEVPGSVEK